MKKPTTNEDRHLESVRDEHFPDSEDRRWPFAGGAGWFKAPRALPVLLQILTDKDVVSRGNPGLAYIELLSRVRESGFVILDHPDDHARIVGYARPRTWREAIQQLTELGLIETKASQGRDLAYALIINPFVAVRHLHKKGRVKAPLWSLFQEKWTKARAEIPDEQQEPPARQDSTDDLFGAVTKAPSRRRSKRRTKKL